MCWQGSALHSLFPWRSLDEQACGHHAAPSRRPTKAPQPPRDHSPRRGATGGAVADHPLRIMWVLSTAAPVSGPTLCQSLTALGDPTASPCGLICTQTVPPFVKPFFYVELKWDPLVILPIGHSISLWTHSLLWASGRLSVSADRYARYQYVSTGNKVCLGIPVLPGRNSCWNLSRITLPSESESLTTYKQ